MRHYAIVQCRITQLYSAALHFSLLGEPVRTNRYRQSNKQVSTDRLFGEGDCMRFAPSTQVSLSFNHFSPIFIQPIDFIDIFAGGLGKPDPKTLEKRGVMSSSCKWKA